MQGQSKIILYWPPHCCVPAFVYGALISRGLSVPSPRSLAQSLGVRVGPNDANPFELEQAANPLNRGVRPSDAIEKINFLLKRLTPDLAFRHIPFCTIVHEQYSSVLAAALTSRCSVGVGVNPSQLAIEASPSERHVMTIIELIPNGVTFRDDSLGGKTGRVGWYDLERAVAEVGDGYWIIGEEVALNLPDCLPYRPGAR